MKEVTEEILERRRQCMKALNSELSTHFNEVYKACDMWSDTGEGTPEETYHKLVPSNPSVR